MKLKPRKDKPYQPVISQSECWAGLKLVGFILDRIVEQGNMPEQVVAKAFEFSSFLRTLEVRHHASPNAEDRATLEAAVLSGAVPTFRTTPSA